MREFMFLIRNQIDHQRAWSPERHQDFLKQCEQYIGRLKANGNLIAAQPLIREGIIIAGVPGAWRDASFPESSEVQVGYYHIRANDLDEAMEIARKNPEFAFSTTARIEVRPLKTKEETTTFMYPSKG